MSKEHAAIVQYKLSDNQHPFRGYHEVHDAFRIMSQRSSFQQSLMQKYTPVIFLKKVKVLIPVPSTINTNTRSQWNVGDRLKHGGGGGRRGQWRQTQQYANPNTFTPPPFHMQVDGNNFASTACPSTNFTYCERFSRGSYLRWRCVRNHTDLPQQMPSNKDDMHWFRVSLSKIVLTETIFQYLYKYDYIISK